MTRIEQWRVRAAELKVETYALYLAYRDPRVPWYAKAFAGCVVAYALSPIDLIPDFIPVLGYLDDLLLLPLGVSIAIRLIPSSVYDAHRAEAARRLAQDRPRSWLGATMIVAIWLLLAAWTTGAVWRILQP